MRRSVIALILAAAMMLLTACGGGVSDQVLLDALTEAAPTAYELYGIIYGDELPHGDALDDGYCQVSSTAPFKSITALRTAIGSVFSPEYSKILENTAFSGVSSDEGAISAKFVERGGVLFVKPEVTEGFAKPRSFDISAARVVKKNPYMAIVLIPHADGDLEVTLQNVNGKWMIDSPMF